MWPSSFKMFLFDTWNTAGPISFGQTGSEYFEELCQTFNESVGFMPGLSYFVACPADGWVCGSKKLWIPNWQTLNFSYKCLYDWNFTQVDDPTVSPGSRATLAVAPIPAERTAAYPMVPWHLTWHMGTLARDFFYVSTSTWVVARFSLEDTVKRQTSSFNTLQILPRIRSRFSSVEHLQTSRACRSTKSTAECPLFAVRSSVFGFLKG